MLSVKGIYEDAYVKLIEPVPEVRRAKAIITILEETEINIEEKINSILFDDLVGVVSVRGDGSIYHDQYITAKKY